MRVPRRGGGGEERRGERRGAARLSRRSRQWSNESSGNAGCLVITFLADRCSKSPTATRLALANGSREVKSVFSRPGLVTGRVPRSGAPRSSSSIEGHRPGNDEHQWSIMSSRRSSRGDDACRLLRRGSFRRADVISLSASAVTTDDDDSARERLSIGRSSSGHTHVLSLSNVKSKPERASGRIPGQAPAPRSRDPAIAIPTDSSGLPRDECACARNALLLGGNASGRSSPATLSLSLSLSLVSTNNEAEAVCVA